MKLVWLLYQFDVKQEEEMWKRVGERKNIIDKLRLEI